MTVKPANPVPLQFRALVNTRLSQRHPVLAEPGTQRTIQQLYELLRGQLACIQCNGVSYVDEIFLYGMRMDLFAHCDLDGEKNNQVLVTLARTSLRESSLVWQLQFVVCKENEGTTAQRYVLPALYLANGVPALPCQYLLTVLESIVEVARTSRPLPRS